METYSNGIRIQKLGCRHMENMSINAPFFIWAESVKYDYQKWKHTRTTSESKNCVVGIWSTCQLTLHFLFGSNPSRMCAKSGTYSNGTRILNLPCRKLAHLYYNFWRFEGGPVPNIGVYPQKRYDSVNQI